MSHKELEAVIDDYQAKHGLDAARATNAVLAFATLAMAQHLPHELLPGTFAAAQKAITGEGDVPLTPVRVAAWNFLEGKHGTSVVVADKEDQAVRLVIGNAWDEGLAAEDVGQSIDYFAPIISDQPGLLDLLTNR